MKRVLLIGILSGWIGLSAGAQQSAADGKSEFNARVAQVLNPPPAPPELPTFDIDFPGGQPEDLVKALNKPLNGTLNVIIPQEGADVMIPPFKLKKVNVAQVFNALMRVSERTAYIESGGGINRRNVSTVLESYEFSAQAPITPSSVWAFRARKANRPPEPPAPNAYRYYQLGPFLEGLKVEDIITAIQTGWKMMGIKNEPALKFHAETKLLVAVGKPEDLALIDEALAGLPRKAEGNRKKDAAASAEGKL
jgi:hypothetical protein